MADIMRAPGTPYQRGSSPNVVSNPRASMRSGIDSRLAMAAMSQGKEIADQAAKLGEKMVEFAKKKHADDTIMTVQEAGNEVRSFSQSLLTTGFQQDDAEAPTMQDGSAWVPIQQRQGGAANNAMAQYQQLMEGFIQSQQERLQLTGRYAAMLRNEVSGVMYSGQNAARTHEFHQHTVAQDQHFANNLQALQQEAATMAFLPDNDALTRMEVMVGKAMAIYQTDVASGRLDANGPIYAAKVQQARQSLWTSMLQARIQAQPSQAMDIVTQLTAPEGEREGNFWRPENINPDLLPGLISEARTAYISDLDYRAGVMVEGGDLQGAVNLIQEEGTRMGMSNAEVARLVKDQRDDHRAMIAEREYYRQIQFRGLSDRAIRQSMEQGRALTRQELFNMGFTGTELEGILSTMKNVWADSNAGDAGALLQLRGIIETNMLPDGSRLNPDGRASIGDLYANEVTRGLLGRLNSTEVGKLPGYFDGIPDHGSTAQVNRTHYLGLFKELLEEQDIDGEDALNALDAWQHEYQRLSGEGEMTTDRLSQLNRYMVGEWVVGNGSGGTQSMRGYQVRQALRDDPASISPPARVMDALTQELARQGITNPTPAQLIKLYTDPRNAAWLEQLEGADGGTNQFAEDYGWAMGGMR